MRNDITSFEKSNSSLVNIWAKSNAKIDSTSIFFARCSVLLYQPQQKMPGREFQIIEKLKNVDSKAIQAFEAISI